MPIVGHSRFWNPEDLMIQRTTIPYITSSESRLTVKLHIDPAHTQCRSRIELHPGRHRSFGLEDSQVPTSASYTWLVTPRSEVPVCHRCTLRSNRGRLQNCFELG